MTTLTPTPRRVVLPALAAASLALGLAVVPLAAVAATTDEDVAAEQLLVEETIVEETLVEQTLVENIQLETLADEPALPVESSSSEPSGPSAEFTATTGRLYGTVTATDGTPLENAAVLFQRVGDSGSSAAVTDTDGQYTTDELTPGLYLLVFAANDRVTQWREDILVVPGADTEVSVSLAAVQQFAVSVHHADGTPAVDHRVVYNWDNSAGTGFYAETDANGDSLAPLEPAEYRIEIQDPQGQSLGWYDGDSGLAAAPVPVTAVADGAPVSIAIVLRPVVDGEQPEEPVEEPYDPIECTHPLTGQTIPCDIPVDELCQNPLTGSYERCDVPCRSDLGLPIECPDLPDTSTVPEYELETLANTGANWQGAAFVAGAFLLLGAGIHVTARLQRRRETR